MANNPADLPNYVKPALANLSPALKIVADCWQSLYNRKADYLPRATMEPIPAYQERVARAVFNNLFRSQIESTSGLLTAFETTGEPTSLLMAIDSGRGVNGKGSDLKTFFRRADDLALRDGLCYVLTDNPEVSLGRTAADPAGWPLWSIVDRRNVLNWKIAWVDGMATLQRVTVRMTVTAADGQYGERMESHYHVFTRMPEGVSLDVWRLNERGEPEAVQPTKVSPIDRIPLRSYPETGIQFPCTEEPILPPLLKSAELNLKLFRQESTLDTIEYRVNAPTAWRVSALPLEERPPIVFGQNYVIELSRDPVSGNPDEVGILEIGGSGIESLRKSIEQTKTEVEAEGLGFLTGARIQRTATEAYLSGAEATATMNGFARGKTQAVANLVEDWCMFSGETAESFALTMDSSLLEQPLDAQEMTALLSLRQAGELDRRTFLELLRQGKQLPPNTDIDELIERIESEFSRETMMPTIPNDYDLMETPNGVDGSRPDEDL